MQGTVLSVQSIKKRIDTKNNFLCGFKKNYGPVRPFDLYLHTEIN